MSLKCLEVLCPLTCEEAQFLQESPIAELWSCEDEKMSTKQSKIIHQVHQRYQSSGNKSELAAMANEEPTAAASRKQSNYPE